MPGELPKWLLSAVIAAVGAIVLWQQFRPEPRTLLACAFIQQSEGTPVMVRAGKTVARRLWLEGTLEKTTQNGMFDFEGWTIASDDNAKGRAPTFGTVWLDGSGAVEGMALYASHADFQPEKLKMATLGSDGYLNPDRSTAFLFINPTEKLLHPADYVCSINER